MSEEKKERTIEQSVSLFQRAVDKIPGGVNSPVRAFGSVGGQPVFIKSAKGAYLYDEDGNRYTDYIGSWGPMILGHGKEEIINAMHKQLDIGVSYGAACALEVEMAELMCSLVKPLEMVRMVNSGTEAVMSAIRTARGFTRKDKIIKFEGCYHGHSDALLVKAGSGVMTAGIPDSSGVVKGSVEDTLLARYNDLESVEALFEKHKGNIACVVVEPVAANMGVVLPKPGFLQGLKKLCVENDALLIFDEVITGFRLGISGAAGYFGVEPDLITYGKIIGGGMPVGAYGGRKDCMSVVSPLGSVYQAGTLSGNPVAMSAGITQLTYLKEHPEVYKRLEEKGTYFRTELKKILAQLGLKDQVAGIASLSCLYFTQQEVVDYETAKTSDTERFARYYKSVLEKGNYFGPSQFEAIFISDAHTKEDIDRTLADMKQALMESKNQ